ncbi:MAG: DUF1152 domain-containing protein, partial [Chloroflexi bacterium]|nr:DUF1152 domain-containing protein [Chloroflexota bacterium]
HQSGAPGRATMKEAAAMPAPSLTHLLRSARRALVIGIGGGGDIAGTAPTLDLLNAFGIEWVAGGLTWERIVYDPTPGPRPLTDLVYAAPLAPAAAMANAHTRTFDGVTFAESAFAEAMGVETLLVDINGGVAGVVESLETAISQLNIDLVIGVDVGGDALAMGNEPGLRSPLADAIMLAALVSIGRNTPTILGVLGYGCDGELTGEELDARIAAVAGAGGYLGAWGITQTGAADLERILSKVRSEASQVPLQAARGALGQRPIRDGAATVRVSPASTITFYLDPVATMQTAAVAAVRVASSTSLEEANDALHAMGLQTELDRERWMHAQGVRDYRRERDFKQSGSNEPTDEDETR